MSIILVAAKTIIGLATSVGAGILVENAVKVVTPAGAKIGKKILVGVGGFFVAGAIGDYAANYSEKTVETVGQLTSNFKVIFSKKERERIVEEKKQKEILEKEEKLKKKEEERVDEIKNRPQFKKRIWRKNTKLTSR
jgi:hypothetical protein